MKFFSLIQGKQLKKPIIWALSFCLLFTQNLAFLNVASAWEGFDIGGETAFAASDDEEVFDIMVLVVEKDLLEENIALEGLIADYPSELIDTDTISERIMRYAEDVQVNSPRTIVKTLTYDPETDSLLDVITALENLYKNGVENVSSRLVGAVFVGQIPLPVVNKNGNRFVSMFPLTDFDDKYYIFNPLTESFDKNDLVKEPKMEVWHGILRAPSFDGDSIVSLEELNDLAKFFDKNHLYHTGEDEYAEFNRKIFYGDLIDEDKRVNETSYKLYQNYLTNMDDLAYLRFNKHWAEDVAGTAVDDLGGILDTLGGPSDEILDQEAAGLAAAGVTGVAADPGQRLMDAMQGGGSGDSYFDQLPDIYSKQIIEKYHVPFTQVVYKAIAQSNDFARYTFRYAAETGGIDSVPALIAMKDEFTKQYLRTANDAIEEKVNHFASVISVDLPIVANSAVSGTVGGLSLELGYKNRSTRCNGFFGAGCGKKYPPFKVFDWGTVNPFDLLGGTKPLELSPIYFNNYYTASDDKMYINGVSEDALNSPKQCFPYLGTMYEGGDEYSVLTRSIRSDNSSTGATTYHLAVNGVGLSPAEAQNRMNMGEGFDFGMLIEGNSEHGYPAFYNDSPLDESVDDSIADLEEGDIILSIEDMTYWISTGIKKFSGPAIIPDALKDENKAPVINRKLVKDHDITVTVPIDEVPMVLKGSNQPWPWPDKKYFSFETEVPLIECKPCSIYKEILGEEPPEAGVASAMSFPQDPGEDPFVLSPFAPGFFKIDDKYYYLSSEHGGGGQTLVRNQKELDDAVQSFNLNVRNKKSGGKDEDKNYWDKYSYFKVRYFDTDSGDSGQILTTDEIKLDHLSPIYSLQSSSAAYRSNDLKGCFYSSAMLHDDRCFSMLATYPVLDVAGSYEPFSRGARGLVVEYEGGSQYYDSEYTSLAIADPDQITGEIAYEHQFPAGQKLMVEDEDNPGEYEDFDTHNEMFQLPSGREFEDVDDIYVDACFNFLPAQFPNTGDSNGNSGSRWHNYDYYTEVIQMMNLFAKKEGKKNDNIPYGGSGRNVTVVDSTTMFDLGEAEGVDITVATFAERFGLWNGKDDDGNGIVDFSVNTENQLVFDMVEAKAEYGLDPDNIYMVSRFLLGPRFDSYTNPLIFGSELDPPEAGEYWYPLPLSSATFKPATDLVLKVKPDIAFTIPSLIIHNEPTNFTIGEQLNAGFAQSWPIDNPRYVAFVDKYGDVQKLDYPNLFDAASVTQFGEDLEDVDVNGVAQWNVYVDLFAQTLLSIPGSSKLAEEAGGSVKEYVKNEIFDVSTHSDEEVSIFDSEEHSLKMLSADKDVIMDALYWNSLSVDDKHEYVLKYYLNQDLEAYVNDSYEGYEAAYLVFDGGTSDDGDFIDMAFNRAVEEDEYDEDIPEGDTFEEMFPDVDEHGNEKDKDNWKWIPFVLWITDELYPKLTEIWDFMADIPGHIGMVPICGDKCFDAVQDCSVLTKIEISTDRVSAYSDGVSSILLTVEGFDQNEKPFENGEYPSLQINISQDNLNPVLEIEKTDFKKTLDPEGKAYYKLLTTPNPGEVKVFVEALFSDEVKKNNTDIEDLSSEEITLSTSAKSIDLLGSSSVMVAGDEEEIEVIAQLNGGGVLDPFANNEVTFDIVEGKDSVEFVDGYVVDAENGLASVYIKPATKAGEVKIVARVSDGAVYADGIKDFSVVPAEPAKIRIITDTDVLVANNQSKANVSFELYDKYDNQAYNAFTKVAVFIFGKAALDYEKDLDGLIPGVQMNFVEGRASIEVLSEDEIGNANLYAVLLDYKLSNDLAVAVKNNEQIDFFGTIGASKKFEVLGEAKMQLLLSQSQIDADGEGAAHVSAALTSVSGDVLGGYNGPVSFNIMDGSIAEFSELPPIYMTDGEMRAYISSTTKAGDVNIEVSAPGFASSSVDLTTLPGDAVKIELVSEDDVILTDSIAGTILQAKLLDEYDNLAYLDQKVVAFGASAGTASMVEFIGETFVQTVEGKAEISVRSSGLSGFANLAAAATDVEQAKLGLQIKKRISEKFDFDEINPKALYINLLGSAFSDFGKDDLAASLLFKGQSQAVLSTTADDGDYLRSVFVDGYGQVDLVDSENVMADLVLANDSFPYQKVNFFDGVTGGQLAEMFVVPKDGLDLEIVGPTGEEELSIADALGGGSGDALAEPESASFADYEEGILVQRITDIPTLPILKFNADESEILIIDNDLTVGSISKEGRVSVSSSLLTYKLPTEEDVDQTYFTLLLYYKGQPLAQVMFKQNFDANVQVLSSENEFENFWPGIYLKLFDDDSNYQLVSGFSRYSTSFNKGVYVVDTNQEMDSSMAPGLPYVSLESAGETAGVGFGSGSGNKNMLLFAAGNTVGESNLAYAGETGVLLGDPTISIDNAEEDLVSDLSYYTKDVGSLVYSGDRTITELISFDYNGDDREDLLIVYGDGKLRLLQNENSNKKYLDKGIVLNVVNGILSLSKIDINNDGFDDLIIGTDNSCIQGEQCLYIYENNEGSFDRKNLTLNTAAKIYEMYARDLNNDDLPDIALSDSSGNVYVFWNEDGEINPAGDKLGNFSIHVDGIEMIDDILVSYNGLPSESRPYFVEMTVKEEKYDFFIVGDKLYVRPGYSGPLPSPSPEEAYIDEYQIFEFDDYLGNLPETVSSTMQFLLPNHIPALEGSTKTAIDLNGAPIELYDNIEHSIVLKNNTGSTITGLKLSDLTPSNQRIYETTLKCLDVGCSDDLYWEYTNPLHRNKVISGISVPANGVRTISFETTMEKTPKVSLLLGDYELGAGDSHDLYFDILVRPDVNQAELITYFKSGDELDSDGRVEYEMVDVFAGVTENPLEEEFKGWSGDEAASKTSAASEDVDAATEEFDSEFGAVEDDAVSCQEVTCDEDEPTSVCFADVDCAEALKEAVDDYNANLEDGEDELTVDNYCTYEFDSDPESDEDDLIEVHIDSLECVCTDWKENEEKPSGYPDVSDDDEDKKSLYEHGCYYKIESALAENPDFNCGDPAFAEDPACVCLFENKGSFCEYENADGDALFAGDPECVCQKSFELPEDMEVDMTSLGPVGQKAKNVFDSLSFDADFDGLPNSWDSVQNGLQAVGDFAGATVNMVNDLADAAVGYVTDAIKAFKCSGAGCLPIPYNHAFLVPMDISGSGGVAMFAWGTPNPPFVSGLYPSNSVSSGRIYLSPTLTMGVGMALCLGPVQAAACYAFALPMGMIPGIAEMCAMIDKLFQKLINKAVELINEAMDYINEGIEEATQGVVSASGSGVGQDSSENGSNGNYGGSTSPLVFDMKSNIKIPGFPSVFTNWIDKQIDEIYSKILGGLNIYLILPDFGSLIKDSIASMKNFGNMKSVHDFLRYVSKIPFIQIKGEDIQFKIPIIQKEQILKYERQAKTFKKNIENQIKNIKEFWTCDDTAKHKTICDKFILDATKFANSVQQNLNAIESYKKIPAMLQKWRTMEQKYATQLICYMDAIMELVGGYMKRQAKIINDWMKAIRDMIDAIKSWKAILKLVLEYQESCDDCKSERHGMLGFLLQLFVVIPEPPIIPFPKIPDIVFDISKIKMGATVLWPDITFDGEPIILPDLPTLTLPEIIPEVFVQIPEIDVIPEFTFDFDLPDLPPLMLPTLPDLPKPFTVPTLPKLVVDIVATIKAILKLLCLIKQALIPINEVTPLSANLKTEIETLTNPGVTPVFPISLALAINWPEIEYKAPVEYRWTLHQKYGVNTAAIYYVVEKAAMWWNDQVEKYVGKVNEGMSIVEDMAASVTDVEALYDEYGKDFVEEQYNKAKDAIDKKLKEKGINLPDSPDWIDVEVETDADFTHLIAYEQEFNMNDPKWAPYNKTLDEIDYLDAGNYGYEGMSEMANLRNSVLAYANNVSSFENINSFDAYDTLVAEKKNLIASSSLTEVSPAEIREFERNYDPVIEIPLIAAADTASDRTEMTRMLIALEQSLDTMGNTDTGDVSSAGNIVTDDTLSIFTGDEKEDVLNYNQEISNDTQLMFIDADSDSDMDLIYTLGGDLYLKENYEFEPDNPSDYPVLHNPESLSSYSEGEILSVQGYSVSGENNGVASVGFIPSLDPSVVGYEIFVYPSLLSEAGSYRFYAEVEANDAFGAVGDVDGFSNILNAPERDVYTSLSSFSISEEETVYARDDTVFVIKNSSGFSVIEMELEEGEFYTATPSVGNATIQIFSGTLEKMKQGENIDKPLQEGNAFMIGDRMILGESGGADLEFSNGASMVLSGGEEFEILDIQDEENPSVELSIANGNYYSRIYALSDNGGRSLVSSGVALAPNVCSDDTPPLPALSSTDIYISVMETLTLDASASFDPGGEIEAYYLDLDTAVDEDGDGDTLNDIDYWSDDDNLTDGPDADDVVDNDMTNPRFNVGPFDEIGDHQVALNIMDTAHHISSQIVNIHVYVPKINLDPVFVEVGVVSGDTEPPTGNMLYKLIRERAIPRVIDGKLKLFVDKETVVTDSANDAGQYVTSMDGTYVISDFVMDDVILVINAAGEIIAEIDEKTGNFYVYEEKGYTYEIVEASPPNESTNAQIIGPDGNTMATLYFVSDGNIAVDIYDEFEFTTTSVENLSGVDISDDDAEDEFEFMSFPATDPNYPGGAYLYYVTEGIVMTAIDSAGNIDLLDERMSIKKKDNQFDFDPFVYELWFASDLGEMKIASIYVSPKGLFDKVQIVGPDDVPRKFPSGISPQYVIDSYMNTEDGEEFVESPFGDVKEGNILEPPIPIYTDIAGRLKDYAMSLYYMGIIGGDTKLNPDMLATRSEFVIMLLKMLCIVPRPEAYKGPSPFSDIPYTEEDLPYYYPFVKEGSLLELVFGYGGEADPFTGKTPFKPGETINLAETVAVILRGLEMKGVLDLSTAVPEADEVWFDPLLDAAQNLTAYTADGVALKSATLITSEEAQDPGKLLTKEDLIELTFRVLDAFNCHDIDADNDGMSDYCEEKWGIDDPDADEDDDGLINSLECLYGSDPFDPDTDDGGQTDGDEVLIHGTNPIYAIDDYPDTDGDGLTDIAETTIYGTDPNLFDTDGGGVGDGDEVLAQLDPLEKEDDAPDGGDGGSDGSGDGDSDGDDGTGQIYETEPGIYLVPPACVTCPCLSTFKYKSDLRTGDVLYTIIVNNDPINPKIYAKSNEEQVQ